MSWVFIFTEISLPQQYSDFLLHLQNLAKYFEPSFSSVDHDQHSRSTEKKRFMLTKSWHTATIANQRRVYEAEQAEEAKKKQEVERQKMLAQEIAFEQNRKTMLGEKSRGNDIETMKGKGGSLSFMYEPPPGYAPHENSVENIGKGEFDRNEPERAPINEVGVGPVVDDSNNSGALNPGVIKPLGLELRNVRCVKCKQWGHQMGDSACPMKAVSVESELFRQQIEDPLMVFDRSRGAEITDRLVLRQTIDGIHGGVGADSANQQILLSDDDEEPSAPSKKGERKAMKQRLKELRKQLKSDKKKKHKKHKNKKSKDSSSSSDSSEQETTSARPIHAPVPMRAEGFKTQAVAAEGRTPQARTEPHGYADAELPPPREHDLMRERPSMHEAKRFGGRDGDRARCDVGSGAPRRYRSRSRSRSRERGTEGGCRKDRV